MNYTPKTLAVKLTRNAERIVKKGHPWVFSDSIVKITEEGNSGDLAILFDNRTNKTFAVGLYDPDSPIQIKILHSGGSVKINEEFFQEKIQEAFNVRKSLFETDTNAYRFIFGENDGFPGLILDVYNQVGVIKIYSSAWIPYLQMLTPLFVETADLKCLILRMSRNIQKLDLSYKEGDILYGELKNSEIEFKEYGVKFKADLLLGHKTGFFLDHRENRHRIGEISKNKTVLDVFSYAGGFSIHALAGGAKEVTSLDFSGQALELAKENAKLNPHSGKHLTLQGDAFEILNQLIRQRKRYDIVIIDPPSFAKSESEREVAMKKYAELTELGVKLTQKGGILLLASCSSRITSEEFLSIHENEFSRLGIYYKMEEFTEHAIDHPVTFDEGAYLKSAYYRV